MKRNGESMTANDKDTEAEVLAQKHYQIEKGIIEIRRITGDTAVEVNPDEPIKLLEVNTATIASGVMPLKFGPNPNAGIHYPSVIIEVTPDEFEKIQSQELPLPSGWKLGNKIPRQDDGG